MNKATLSFFIFFLLLVSCKDKKKEYSIDEYTIITDSISLKKDVVYKNEVPEILNSTDSIFQIKIYKTVSRLKNGYAKMQQDSMQYTCLELSRRDSGLIGFPSYRTLSDAMPEHYLNMKVIDTNFIAISEWFLCESNSFKYKFHFAFDAFKNFNDSTEITLGYDGPFEGSIMTKFNSINFNKIISELTSPDSKTKKADNNWLQSQGIEISGYRNK